MGAKLTGVLDPKGEHMGLDGPSIPARVEPLELPEPARDPDREQPTEEPAAPTEEPVPA
jgi:hypothetical protein